jgi:hypothetical protein
MSRRSQLIFTGFFLAVIFLVPLSQAGIEIYRGHVPQFLEGFTQMPTRANLRSFERDIESSSVFARVARPWVQSLLFLWLRNPGEKALMGRDGWLFYKPDVRYLVEASELHDDDASPVGTIVRFQQQLWRRGIHLLVLPMPGKPSVYPDELTSRIVLNEDAFVSPTRQVIAKLRAAGVETLDLFEAFHDLRLQALAGESYYLAQDTHWSGKAARAAAEVVSRRLIDLGWAQIGSTQYSIKPIYVRRRGDIVRMADVPGIESSFPAEEVQCFQVFDEVSGESYKDDSRSPLLLLGDSFFRMYQTDTPGSAGFIAHLAQQLRMPMASIVDDGGASTLVRQELSRRPALLEGKKLVIWEFVERDIRFGTDGWKHVPLGGTSTEGQ